MDQTPTKRPGKLLINDVQLSLEDHEQKSTRTYKTQNYNIDRMVRNLGVGRESQGQSRFNDSQRNELSQQHIVVGIEIPNKGYMA